MTVHVFCFRNNHDRVDFVFNASIALLRRRYVLIARSLIRLQLPGQIFNRDTSRVSARLTCASRYQGKTVTTGCLAVQYATKGV